MEQYIFKLFERVKVCFSYIIHINFYIYLVPPADFALEAHISRDSPGLVDFKLYTRAEHHKRLLAKQAN